MERKASIKQEKLKQQREAQRAAKNAAISDVSEVETVQEPQSLFNVDINLDNLKTVLDHIKNLISAQEDKIQKIDTEVRLRATEFQVGKCLERISQGVSKQLGEKPHKFSLNEPSLEKVLDGDAANNGDDREFKSADARILRSGVEQLCEKMEIISKVCLQNKKFKPKAEERLNFLEEEIKKFVSKQTFFDEMEQTEKRVNYHMRESLNAFEDKIAEQEQRLNDAIIGFEKKVNDHQSEVLWRI